jgi:hypothetical protein
MTKGHSKLKQRVETFKTGWLKGRRMKRLLALLLTLVLFSSFGWAGPSPASLVPVKATHHRDKRVQRHRAHKAGKHHTPKRHRHATI